MSPALPKSGGSEGKGGEWAAAMVKSLTCTPQLGGELHRDGGRMAIVKKGVTAMSRGGIRGASRK